MLGHRWDSSPKIRFAPDSPLEQRKFELLVAREDGWPVLTTLIDLKALLLHENQATFSREGPTDAMGRAARTWQLRRCI